MSMCFYVLSLFPEMVEQPLSHSIIGRAIKKGVISLNCINIRDYSLSKSRRVDDYPYGGGVGLVMCAQPVFDSVAHAKKLAEENTRVIYLTPQGRPFSQQIAEELSKETALIFLCGHYEGIDERVIEEAVTDEISLGDFVLTGGEVAAVAIIDAVSRLIPGVLNKDESSVDESFSGNLLEYPQYTRPAEFRGRAVPEVLISGHHENVRKWRMEQSLERTRRKRPDLLKEERTESEWKKCTT